MSKLSESKILFWLSLSSLSVRKQTELIKKFGSAEKLWFFFEAESAMLSESLGEKCFAELKRYRSEAFVDACLEKLKKDGISVLTALNPLYPEELLQHEVAAPLVFYYKGELSLLKSIKVAVVGSRASTSYGREMTERVVTDLVENGITIVSGLATGIDTYAHECAIASGGKSIAVLANGLNNVTPVSGVKLIERILESGGLVMSEYKPTVGATRYTFPERNRLISGLSKGVVVVEAGEKSGALITARCALEQGREVFAVPGNITSTRSVGCNDLLYEGASFIRSGLDVLEYLSISPKARHEKKQIILDKDEKKLYSLLEEGDRSLDELIEGSGIMPSEVSEVLLRMELNGLISRISGNMYSLKL